MLGGIGTTQLLILLLVVVLLFGTKKIKTLGSDLGQAIKDLRNATKEEDSEQ